MGTNCYQIPWDIGIHVSGSQNASEQVFTNFIIDWEHPYWQLLAVCLLSNLNLKGDTKCKIKTSVKIFYINNN